MAGAALLPLLNFVDTDVRVCVSLCVLWLAQLEGLEGKTCKHMRRAECGSLTHTTACQGSESF